MDNINVAQWNFSNPKGRVSGLQRYDNELYKHTSENVNVKRYPYNGLNIKSFMDYKKSDITHITSQALAFLKVFKNVNNCVVTVHDIIPHVLFNLRRKVTDKWIINELLLKTADMFIADSEYTKIDLMNHFNIPEEKIRVVYLGVDHQEFKPMLRAKCRQMFGMEDDKTYLLSVSSGEPWKNTEILKKLPYEVIDIGYGRSDAGIIEDKRLVYLYNACDVFLAPSVYEGFGLPALEAMACGTPVIASNVTALPEVVKDGGKLVDPYNVFEWYDAIENILNYREKWSSRALKRSEAFSWEACAKNTINVYKEMV